MAHQMRLHRLCTSFCVSCLLCGSILLPSLLIDSAEGAEAPGGRDIIILDSSGSPAWKVLWDQAREYARQKKYSLAAASYSELIQTKAHIEEAQWEYCKVLVELKDWLAASNLLEGLLETDGDRTEYLQLAGTVALKNREFKRAVDYFGRVYGSDPVGPVSIEALKGLIAGLQGLGRKNMAFPLMEQLYLRTPHDQKLVQDLAGYAHEMGDLKKARDYYSSLVARSNADDRILLQASTVFEEPGTEKEALAIWEKYLEKQPTYLPFHKKIADYYMLIGKPQSALPHILYMIDNGVEDDDLLLVAGRIYLEDEGRSDKALHYFEEYAEKHPEDIAIQVEIKKIQMVLANDFLSIVENDGAWILWRDLVQVTPNRLAIYQEMATQLAKRGKNKELLSVLLIIHHNSPDDEANIFRIAELYFKQKKFSEALAFLQKMKGQTAKSYTYLLLRARVEERCARELDALQHYESCLRIMPTNQAVRLRSIQLAGRLGLVERMKALYPGPAKKQDREKELDLTLAFIEGLRLNALFGETEDLYAELVSESDNISDSEIKILFHKAETLRLAGQYFQAEQVLREILARNISTERSMYRLVRLALTDNDLTRAQKWLALLQQKGGRQDWRNCADRMSRDIFRLHIAILMKEESLGDVVREGNFALKKLENLEQSKEVRSMVLELQIALCRAYLSQEQYDQCLRLLTQLREKQPDNLELAILWFQLSRDKGKSATAFAEIDQLLEKSGHLSLLRTLTAATLELEYGEYTAGLHHLDMVQKVLPDSMYARVLRARHLIGQGHLQDALQVYRGLITSTGEQAFFRQQILEIDFKLGNYDEVVKESAKAAGTALASPEEKETKSKHVTRDYWRKLLLARALWVDKQWDASLKVYEMLLLDPVQNDFQSAITQQSVQPFAPPVQKSFWNMLSFSASDSRDPLALYMDPEFVGRHLGQPIDHITAGIYEKYRWQKLIRNEYLAKRAVQQKDILSAEKQYKQLIREDQNVEGLYDLARIYGRLGEYGKEAELYQVMRKYGPVYPDLKASIQQNEVRRKPRLSADFDYVEKEGRDGSIDIIRKSQGSTLWMMPNLDKEVSLDYRRNAYSSSDADQTHRGHTIVGAYSQDISQDTDILFRLGAETVDQYDTTPLAGVEVSRMMDQVVRGYLAFGQDAVYDTLEAIEAAIYSQDYSVGLTTESKGGYVFGGEYRRRRYSDDNSQNQFHIWSSYTLFNELNTFKFGYNYRFLANSMENRDDSSEVTLVGLSQDIPYWSPGEYWEHLATFSFQHLLKAFSLLKETPSYYVIDSSVGYESDQNVLYKVGFEIFLEMSPHFLLKGNLNYCTSTEYEQAGALVSLIYRW